MKCIIVFTLVVIFSYTLVAQDELSSDRYCRTEYKIYDFNTTKRLKNKDALVLLEPYPDAYSYYEKSIKQKNASLIYGGVLLGCFTYVAGSTELKDGDFSDYNTFQKAIFVTTLASSIGLVTNMFLFQQNRNKSLIIFNDLLYDDSTTSIEGVSKDIIKINLQLAHSGVGLNVQF